MYDHQCIQTRFLEKKVTIDQLHVLANANENEYHSLSTLNIDNDFDSDQIH